MWYYCRDIETLIFRDYCTTVHCNQQCPDKIDFAFDLSDPRNWIVNATSAVVASITIISIAFKVSLSLCMYVVYMYVHVHVYLSCVCVGGYWFCFVLKYN